MGSGLTKQIVETLNYHRKCNVDSSETVAAINKILEDNKQDFDKAISEQASDPSPFFVDIPFEEEDKPDRGNLIAYALWKKYPEVAARFLEIGMNPAAQKAIVSDRGSTVLTMMFEHCISFKQEEKEKINSTLRVLRLIFEKFSPDMEKYMTLKTPGNPMLVLAKAQWENHLLMREVIEELLANGGSFFFNADLIGTKDYVNPVTRAITKQNNPIPFISQFLAQSSHEKFADVLNAPSTDRERGAAEPVTPMNEAIFRNTIHTVEMFNLLLGAPGLDLSLTGTNVRDAFVHIFHNFRVFQWPNQGPFECMSKLCAKLKANGVSWESFEEESTAIGWSIEKEFRNPERKLDEQTVVKVVEPVLKKYGMIK